MKLRLPSFVIACVLTFILSATYEPMILGHLPFSRANTGAPFTDLGYFVVAGNFPANNTSAPRTLIAGTWGDELNFTSPANATFTFYESYGSANQTLDWTVNASILHPMIVWLELGGPTLNTPTYLDVKW